jgi:hypothetical protein
MYVLQLQEHGNAELQSTFERAIVLFSHLEPIIEKAGDEGEEFTTIRFEVEGPGWPFYTPEYAKRKAKLFPGKTIGRVTDRLYLSFRKGNADNVRRVSALSGEFGSAVSYAEFFHQRRPVIDFTEEQEQKMAETAVVELNEMFRNLGFEVS